MVGDGYETKYQRYNEAHAGESIRAVNAFSIVLMVSWQDVRITVEEVVQSLIVRIHGKAYRLVVARRLEKSSNVWEEGWIMGCGQLFADVVRKKSRGRMWLVVRIEAGLHVSSAKKWNFEKFHRLLRPHILEKFHHCTFTMAKTAPPKKRGGTYLKLPFFD